MKQHWWQESVVYQIYPRSFYDSNGDGIGDIPGITQKLDYLKELGVDVVWLSPVYKSPNDDNGYDISDYQSIMDEFGTMAAWEAMLAGMHERGIRLIMDLVVNHTSDEHPWFVESRKSKDNPYRDFYIWRPGKEGGEPNNWGSAFGGSAWAFDETTGEYYLHLFSAKQPDLNWENPKVRSAIFDMMNWWLKKGIDGFRMDVINFISKTPGLPDVLGIGEGYQFPAQYTVNGPRLLEFLSEMKREVLSKYDILTVGEMPMVNPKLAAKLTDAEDGFLNMIFHFEHMDLDSDQSAGIGKWAPKPLNLLDLKETMSRWQLGLAEHGWNSMYLSNHDQPRQVSRFGDDKVYRVESAKMLATFLHMLQGTPYIYQGEEIGMTNVRFESLDDYRDIETLNVYRELVERRGVPHEAAMELIYAKGRDNARTPMQWDAGANAGFTTGLPWIRVNPNFAAVNVEAAIADPNSIFHYYQRLIQLRKTHPVIVYGKYAQLLAEHEQIYAFTRTLADEQLLVILNFGNGVPICTLPAEIDIFSADLLISNYPVETGDSPQSFAMRPFEARVYRIK